ncbi:hypothetical protein E2C01_034429 [Portunus trituberculatus]|uniref:Uncharacterized protein n=1 Tax=Portunus trituberculatus TaxID=210409 RepID=A0A5B7F5T4_PORTR|nr:hypothetical protein [Portunus trituberculatus]
MSKLWRRCNLSSSPDPASPLHGPIIPLARRADLALNYIFPTGPVSKAGVGGGADLTVPSAAAQSSQRQRRRGV